MTPEFLRYMASSNTSKDKLRNTLIDAAEEIDRLRSALQGLLDALQSQNMEVIIEALETAQNNLGPRRPFGSANPNSDDYDHDAFMWDYYQRAIDHARHVEGKK